MKSDKQTQLHESRGNIWSIFLKIFVSNFVVWDEVYNTNSH